MIRLSTHFCWTGLLVLLLACCQTCYSATIYQGFTLGSQTQAILTGGGPLDRFDPALGELTAVNLMIETYAQGRSHPFENTGDVSTIYPGENTYVFGAFKNGDTGDVISSAAGFMQNGPYVVPAHETEAFPMVAWGHNITVFTGISMTQFIGSTSMNLRLDLYTNIFQVTGLSGSFDVHYEYEPVPEPSSVTLCAPALLAFGVLVRRKRLAKG